VKKFDLIGDVLDNMQLRGTVFFRSSLAAPWGMSLEAVDQPRFHISLNGDFVLGSNNKEFAIPEMSVVLVQGCQQHWVADQPGRALIPGLEARQACALNNPMFQSGTITNQLMCGIVGSDSESTHPLMSTLPDVLSLPRIPHSSSLWKVVESVDAEIQDGGASDGRLVDRLTEIIYAKVIQEYFLREELPFGFLAAVKDDGLACALQAMHTDVGQKLTVDKLAGMASMSRTTFQRRFLQTTGQTPIDYLIHWRLQKARRRLLDTLEPIESIAEQAGFASGGSFIKAFRRVYGQTPAAMRKASLQRG